MHFPDWLFRTIHFDFDFSTNHLPQFHWWYTNQTMSMTDIVVDTICIILMIATIYLNHKSNQLRKARDHHA